MEDIKIFTEPMTEEERKENIGLPLKMPVRYHLVACLKDLKFGRPAENQNVSGVKATAASLSPAFTMDPKGPFTIFLDFKRGKIMAAHSGSRGYDAVIEGDDAEAVSKKIITEGLVSSLEHAAYLRRDLAEQIRRAGGQEILDEIARTELE